MVIILFTFSVESAPPILALAVINHSSLLNLFVLYFLTSV